MVGNTESSVIMILAIVTVPSSAVVTTPLPWEAALAEIQVRGNIKKTFGENRHIKMQNDLFSAAFNEA